jgi:aminopeptidase N
MVLHMLRNLVGDEPFFATLSHFLHHNAFQPVDTYDFIRSVKTVTGQNLDWFFDQWLFKPGHPVLEIRSEWDEPRKVVRLKVAQVQDFSKGIPVFRLPVAVKIVTAKGKDIRKVWIRQREEMFEFPAETKPLLVRFDEGNMLIKEVTFSKDLDELLYQLQHDDVVGRMAAAGELLRFKDDPRVLAGLEASAQSDEFWAVRRSAVEALAPIASPRIPALLKKACHDPSSMVRSAAVLVLGDRKDRGLAEFFKDVFKNDASGRVQAEALLALGKTDDPAMIQFLRQSAAVSSHQNMVKRAAESAVKKLEKK